jgi:transposase
MPIRIIVTDGTTADCTQASALIAGIEAQKLLADKAYDTDAIIEATRLSRTEPVIPPKCNRKTPRAFDRDTYKHRHLVENAILKLKLWRGIATRYAKRADSFVAAVQIRCLALWLQIS